jgi:hypothetical protein
MIPFALRRKALKFYGNTAYARRWLRLVAADKLRAEPVLLIHGAAAKWGTKNRKEAA